MQAKQSLRSAHPRQPAYTHTDPFQRGNGWRQCRQMWACRGPSLANLCPQWASMGIRGLAWAPPKPASCLRWRWWADVGPPQPTPCQYRPCVGNSGAHQSPPAPALGQCRGGILCYLGSYLHVEHFMLIIFLQFGLASYVSHFTSVETALAAIRFIFVWSAACYQ